MKMLVTGGTGVLGRQVVRAAIDRGHEVTVMTREHEAELPEGASIATADVLEPGPLSTAVAGAELVIHCATDPRGDAYNTEVEGSKNLLEACTTAGVVHLVYVSIVGIDRIPLSYYRAKLDAEEAVSNGDVPWTILRATQFHELIAGSFKMASKKLPVIPVPRGFKFQPIDTSDCARALLDLAEGAPAGRAPDIGGPEIRPIEEFAHLYTSIMGINKRIVRLPSMGKKPKAFRAGGNLCPENLYGTITFEEFMQERRNSQS
ncbi:MAG: NAD(P)H-binding protein [Actinobacteria bacterium]|nr:NAD(P)H-binding protein [Actinomycetota bacterium]